MKTSFCFFASLLAWIFWPSVLSAQPQPDNEWVIQLSYSTVCGERTSCLVVRAQDAGVDDDGRALFVVTVEDVVPTSASNPSADERTQDWLVVLEDETVANTTLLAEWTEHDERSSQVDMNTYSYEETHFGTWYNDVWITLQLSPLAVLRFSVESGDRMMSYYNSSHRSRDWGDFRFRESWSLVACDEEGDIISYGEGEYDSVDGAWMAIPTVSLDVDFAVFGWREAELGTCALTIDSSATPLGTTDGFIIHGHPGTAEDASLRVVAASHRILFVELRDDTWIEGSDSWLFDDHLEIWLGGRLPNPSSDCLLPGTRPLFQWGISLDGSEVYPAFGDPRLAPEVTAHRPEGSNVVRLRIVLPEMPELRNDLSGQPFESLTLVYSDSDDGLQQERLIATSRLEYGRWDTLGELFQVETIRAVCSLVDGRLDHQLSPLESHRTAAASSFYSN